MGNCMNRILLFVFFATLPLFFASCSLKIFKGKKRHKRKTENVVTVPIDAGDKDISDIVDPSATLSKETRTLIKELIPLWKRRLDYNTFSGKAKMDYDGPSGSVSFSANFRIVKDSLVWVHISALGGLYNVARVMVTPDSFFMINYSKKEVMSIPVSEVASVLPVPVSFNQLQGLFTGEPLSDGKITFARESDSSWLINTADTTYLQQLTIARSDSLMSFGNLQTRQPNGPQAMIDYNDYQLVDNRRVSKRRTVHAQNGVTTHTIEMNLVNVEFDSKLNFPFSFPKNYAVKNIKE